jgi:hypothetical protein
MLDHAPHLLSAVRELHRRIAMQQYQVLND